MAESMKKLIDVSEEKDAKLINLDCSFLPYEKKDSFGFGGKFKNKIIDRLVTLVFSSNNEEHRINCTNFKVFCIPPNIPDKEREELIRVTPSVLGMNVISEFKLYMEKNRFFLEC